MLRLGNSFLLAIAIARVINCRDGVRIACSLSPRSYIGVWCFMNGQTVEPPRTVMGVQLYILLSKNYTVYIDNYI